MNNPNRRNFLFMSSGVTAGSMLVEGIAEADETEITEFAGSGLVTGAPKALKHKEIPGFLGAAQISPHHTAHYGGALKAVVAPMPNWKKPTNREPLSTPRRSPT